MAQASKELKPELCVIGGGPGGLTVAGATAVFDVKSVLIEKDRLGGASLNRGSVPAQALIAAAARIHAARTNARFGIKAGRINVDFGAVDAYVRATIGALSPNASHERLGGLGVNLIKATARFVDPRTVVAGDFVIKARRFVIATGSLPVIPAIPGLPVTPHLTEETIFQLREIPRHLIVIGAGTVGLEMAQVFRRLGAEVTVLEAATPLAGSDPEAADVVVHALAREGVKLRTGVAIAKVGRVLAKLQVVLTGEAGEETIEGSHLLIAAGRRPNLDDLALEAGGIRSTEHGLVLDRSLRTTNKRVYAAGDVAGGLKATQVAEYHAGLVIRHTLFGAAIKVNHETVPWVTYTDPELAQVGMLEDEARAHAGAIRVLRWPYLENDRAQIERTTAGHIKIVTDRGGEILGATIVGARAAESITPWTLAVSQKLNIRALASLVVPYPSYAEVGKRAAITYFTHGLTRQHKRRIMGWLRRRR
jgi:pyruvate/2-oxoglutarate dehydrogenase complex dihydrolipoamide dehydrogenase (E3) component